MHIFCTYMFLGNKQCYYIVISNESIFTRTLLILARFIRELRVHIHTCFGDKKLFLPSKLPQTADGRDFRELQLVRRGKHS